jgi:hypothetical protein
VKKPDLFGLFVCRLNIFLSYFLYYEYLGQYKGIHIMPKTIYVRSYSGDAKALDHGFHESEGRHSLNAVSAETKSHIEFARFTKFPALPNTIVLQAGLEAPVDANYLSPRDLELRDYVRDLFQKENFSKNFHSLNHEQKEFLSAHGAARTLLYLGRIDKIYPLEEGDITSQVRQINELSANEPAYKDELNVVIHHEEGLGFSRDLDPSIMGDIRSVVYMDADGLVVGYSNFPETGAAAGYKAVSHTHRSMQGQEPDARGLATTTLGITAIGALALFALVAGKCCRRKRHAPGGHNPAV